MTSIQDNNGPVIITIVWTDNTIISKAFPTREKGELWLISLVDENWPDGDGPWDKPEDLGMEHLQEFFGEGGHGEGILCHIEEAELPETDGRLKNIFEDRFDWDMIHCATAWANDHIALKGEGYRSLNVLMNAIEELQEMAQDVGVKDVIGEDEE